MCQISSSHNVLGIWSRLGTMIILPCCIYSRTVHGLQSNSVICRPGSSNSCKSMPLHALVLPRILLHLGCLWSYLTYQCPQVLLLRAALNPLSAPPACPGPSGCPIPSLHVTPSHSSVLLANCPRVHLSHCPHHWQRYSIAPAPLLTGLHLDIEPVTTTLSATIQIIPSPSPARKTRV